MFYIVVKNLEIRYPERGRKQGKEMNSYFEEIFGNKIPREGTETKTHFKDTNIISIFGNKIPREGTETLILSYLSTFQLIWK